MIKDSINQYTKYQIMQLRACPLSGELKRLQAYSNPVSLRRKHLKIQL